MSGKATRAKERISKRVRPCLLVPCLQMCTESCAETHCHMRVQMTGCSPAKLGASTCSFGGDLRSCCKWMHQAYLA